MKRPMLTVLAAILGASVCACGPGTASGGGPAWSGPVRESTLLPQGSARAPLPERLFETDAPLVLTVEADLQELKEDREEESEERPGRVILEGPTGERSFPVQIRTRGRFRLNDYICSFPPLRFNFPRDSLQGSALEGLDKVKVVTHCRDRDTYEQNVLEEYLAYRIFGLLTDVSFRVQLALITYRDTSGREDDVSRLAFFIESEEALAERLGGEMVEAEQAHPDRFDPQHTGLMYLFQYMIGNTDWSLARVHNMKLLRVGAEHFAVPYDLDFSGFVNATYAGPSPVVARYVAKVRDRYFWGICSDAIDYEALFAHFNERRDSILDLIRSQAGLTDRNARLAATYVEEFYEIINRSRDADHLIVNRCRPLGR